MSSCIKSWEWTTSRGHPPKEGKVSGMSKNWHGRHLAIPANAVELYGLSLYARLAVIINQKFFSRIPSYRLILNDLFVEALGRRVGSL